MIESLLLELGFSDKEVRVYLAALRLGMQPASVLARHVKMNRVTTYVICKKLIERGVANVITRDNIQYFAVEKPEALVNYAERKRRQWDQRKGAIQKNLSAFKQLSHEGAAVPRTRFYEGIEGIKTVYEDTLRHGSPIRAFLTVETIPKELKDFFMKQYMPELLRRRIRSFLVMPDSPKARRYAVRDRKYHRKTVFVKPTAFPFETEIAIYGKDRVAFISFREGDLTAVLIENEAIHHTLAGVFDGVFKESC